MQHLLGDQGCLPALLAVAHYDAANDAGLHVRFPEPVDRRSGAFHHQSNRFSVIEHCPVLVAKRHQAQHRRVSPKGS